MWSPALSPHTASLGPASDEQNTGPIFQTLDNGESSRPQLASFLLSRYKQNDEVRLRQEMATLTDQQDGHQDTLNAPQQLAKLPGQQDRQRLIDKIRRLVQMLVFLKTLDQYQEDWHEISETSGERSVETRGDEGTGAERVYGEAEQQGSSKAEGSRPCPTIKHTRLSVVRRLERSAEHK